MANFSPSIQFAKRWLATPVAARKAIYDELDDIINLLDSDTPSKAFVFTHADFYQAVATAINQGEAVSTPSRLIHSIETTSLSAEKTSHAANQVDFKAVEARLNESLATQIDEFLVEHTAQLADDLRAWVQMAVRHELANYQQAGQE
ncbi:hypothetical protein [Moraxella cuniculi]|uniref:Uncharacterized protein n=1 Tax=Moraxella cuniculi TaxID=34061 RepID=A0A3S4R2B0_9GAMM|nr:hypothetical protein [Moraxella cuniculi]VEG13996.1 Uncharacterised protein [Moraxella cuniculi]